MENLMTYITVLQDSLRKKHTLLQEIHALTETQSTILEKEKPDVAQFDEIVEKKAGLIDEVLKLDQGFESIFAKIKSALEDQREFYRPQILELQNYIRVVTDLGVAIESAEKKNLTKFNAFLKKEREEIKSFKVSNKTANSYYQNMPNQHREWQTYFFDSKK